MSERNELILYAIWRDDLRRWWVDTAEGCYMPPERAEVICRIDREDSRIMIRWAKNKLRKGKTVSQLRKMLNEQN